MFIREIIKNDINDISKIYTDSWKTTYKNILPESLLKNMSYESSKEKWLSYINIKNHGGFVALDNNKIVGFAMYKPENNLYKCLLLDSLHVIKSAQGKGIGKKLIFTIGKYAYDNKYEKMYIYIVKGNEKAEKIYNYLGARHYKDFIDNFDGSLSNSSILLWDNLNIFLNNNFN